MIFKCQKTSIELICINGIIKIGNSILHLYLLYRFIIMYYLSYLLDLYDFHIPYFVILVLVVTTDYLLLMYLPLMYQLVLVVVVHQMNLWAKT